MIEEHAATKYPAFVYSTDGVMHFYARRSFMDFADFEVKLPTQTYADMMYVAASNLSCCRVWGHA